MDKGGAKAGRGYPGPTRGQGSGSGRRREEAGGGLFSLVGASALMLLECWSVQNPWLFVSLHEDEEVEKTEGLYNNRG